MSNPYSHLRVCDARVLVGEYRQQAHNLLVALYEAAEVLKQTGHGDLIAVGRMYDGVAGGIEDAIYTAEQEDQDELGRPRGAEGGREMSKHTPGPWRWEFNGKHRTLHLVGGRPRCDLTIMDFERWGMNGATMRLRDTAHDGMQLLYRVHERPDWIAPESGREHHKSWHQLLTHPDARLIEAAPDLLEFAQWVLSLKTGGIIEARARVAIAKAEGQ
jgi:hypothetical protein